jgi:hypothetical protein
MTFEKIERIGGTTFWFNLSNQEIQALVHRYPNALASHKFYGKSNVEILNHLICIAEYLEDIKLEEEQDGIRP